ncbi:ABC transporter ATP-binding protein [Aquipuribacter sp. MA13-6]|uniref:ABC transporter ATP-binding protein n=1 Tax=unclassified Aquipuribacter TaxID=2635084 RepID=UPI003EE90946
MQITRRRPRPAGPETVPTSTSTRTGTGTGTDVSTGATGRTDGTAVAVSARALTRTYGDGDAQVHALRGVDLDIPRGTFTAVMGPSGSGKSTLVHCLAALDRPTSGEVVLDGVALSGMGDDRLSRLRGARVGFVFQSFNLVPVLTAAENIRLPMVLSGRSADEDWFGEVVDRLGLTDRLHHRPHELSGGQQQRVAVARALLSRPAVVFADEPTGNLDTATGHEVLDVLRASVRSSGQTVVMVTHDPVAASWADRVVVLSDGRIAGMLDGHPDAAAVTDALARVRAGGAA